MARFLVPAIYLALLFALNVYRAATQSFITDEGYSYLLYVGREPFSLFRQYDANLHVLHTLLCWLSVKLFGLSELTFRLPSLLGCAVYFAGVHRLSGLVFSDSWRRLLAAVLLTANPLIQDHMSVGRGYGLALAFFTWAFCEAISTTPRLSRLAVLLALSVASNFTFLFPTVALLTMVGGIFLRRGVSLSTLVQELVGPWLVLTFLILVMPFSRLEPGSFYYGIANLTVSLQILLEHSVGARPLQPGSGAALVALVFAACLAVVWRFRHAGKETFALLAAGTFVLTVVAMLAAHFLFGVLYPWARTGLFLLFLFPLCLLPLAHWKSGAIVLLALAAWMAQGIRIDRYMEWTPDSNSREMAAVLVALHPADAPPVRIACGLPVCNALRLYMIMWGLGSADIQEVLSWEPGFDYYVLSGDVAEQAARRDLRLVYESPISGIALASGDGR